MNDNSFPGAPSQGGGHSQVCRVLRCALLISALGGLGSAAQAEEGQTDPAPASPPAEAVPSEVAAASPVDRPKDYREGWGFAGLPLANYNSDDGFGFGVKGAVYNYGQNEKPYRLQIALQLFFTTNRVQYHRLFFDAPHFRGSPWRLDGALKYDYVLLANYFGVGNTAYAGENECLVSPDACTPDEARVENYYTSYQKQEPYFILNLRRDLRGTLKLFNGYQLKQTFVTPHTADTLLKYTEIEVDDSFVTLLEEERPYGFQGGFMAYVQAGIVNDSRNREPSPEKGSFSEASARVVYYRAGDAAERESHTPVYAGLNLTGRQFFELPANFVFATRLVADFLVGDVPFYELTSFGGSQDYTGLGGSTSMRAVKSSRYRGKIKVLWTPELRFTPIEFYGGTQKFNISFVAYGDIGRVWEDYAPDGDLLDLHAAVGGGLRIAWNDNFLIRLDYGRDLEEKGSGFYLVFDHAF